MVCAEIVKAKLAVASEELARTDNEDRLLCLGVVRQWITRDGHHARFQRSQNVVPGVRKPGATPRRVVIDWSALGRFVPLLSCSGQSGPAPFSDSELDTDFSAVSVDASIGTRKAETQVVGPGRPSVWQLQSAPSVGTREAGLAATASHVW